MPQMVAQINDHKNFLIGFDLDGTLIDSGEDIRDALRVVFARNKLDQDVAKKVRIGAPFREMLRPYLRVSEKALDDLFLEFRKVYDHSGFPKTKTYAGCIETLEWVRNSGYKMFLATNKPQVATETILKQLNLHSYFCRCFTPDGVGQNRKSKTQMLEAAILELGAGMQTIYIGDSVDDIKACKSHPITCIAASYGYYPYQELAGVFPDYSIKSLNELKKLILSL